MFIDASTEKKNPELDPRPTAGKVIRLPDIEIVSVLDQTIHPVSQQMPLE
jgi:hypothetical protein